MIETKKNLITPIHVLGAGVAELNPKGQSIITFQKGIGIQLMQKILKQNQDEILQKKSGIQVDSISNYTVYLHYFDNKRENIIIMIYLDKKENILKFSDLFPISDKLNSLICSNTSPLDFKTACKKSIKIPKTNGVLAIFIINSGGLLLYSKYNSEKTKFQNYEFQVGGFISAILIFSKEIISKDTDAKLRKINFGNQHFYLITEQDIIFAYLIEEQQEDKLNKRYLYLTSEEFLSKYKKFLGNFDGNVSRFDDFENIIDQYFNI